MAKKFSRGFTLIELLIVMATIAILATIAVPVFIGALERAKVTKDMNNLRQIAVATQLYMNDNNGALPGSTTVPPNWISQLYPKYLSSWYVLISPLDPIRNPATPNRVASDNSANSAVSYGINGTSGVMGMSADKITKPTAFIVFAPAEDNSTAVAFQGIANTTSQTNLAGSANVTVVGAGSGQATTMPGGPAIGGTQNSRTRINAVFADWHVESMAWSGTGPAFTNTTDPGNDPDAPYRWSP